MGSRERHVTARVYNDYTTYEQRGRSVVEIHF